MRRARLWLALALTVVSALAFVTWRKLETRRAAATKVYRIAYDSTPPHYDHIPGKGAVGFAVDVMNEAASRAGVRLDWVYLPNGARAALFAGQIDFSPLGYYRPGAYPGLHQTRPWTEDYHVLVWDKARFPGEMSDWTGRTVSHVGRVASSEMAAARFKGSSLLAAKSRREALRAVCIGTADVAFVDLRVIESALLERPEGCERIRFHVQQSADSVDAMSLFARPEAASVADGLRNSIDTMIDDGSFTRIADRWFVFSGAELRNVTRLQQRNEQLLWLTALCAAMAIAIGGLAILVRKLRVARAAADRARVLQAEFLANVSHEIRTPMNGVIGAAEIVLDTELTATQREYVETVRDSALTQLELLNQILDQSKLESGVMVLDTEAFSPARLIVQIERAFHHAAARKGLWLRHSVKGDFNAYVRGDQLRIRQIVSNLVGNAIKFTAAGGVEIRLAMETTGDMIALGVAVADTGIGIPAGQHASIFERFRQADSSTTRRYGGTGLGLTIARHLAHLMNGDISLQSDSGLGSEFTFRVLLPAAPNDAGVAVRPEHSPIPASGLRVLLVEDNAVNRKVASEMLRKLGAVVTVAVDGRKAVDFCAQQSFDAVLMDCHMPEMDGYAATAAIRKMPSPACDVPIIALTAGVSSEERKTALAAGMSAFLAKPVNRDELAAALADVSRSKPRMVDTAPSPRYT